MSQRARLLISWALVTGVAAAQRLTVSFVGGTNLSNGFPAVESLYPGDQNGNPPQYSLRQSGSRSFIAGASLEAYLTSRFSVEASVLHRPMTMRFLSRTMPQNSPAIETSREQTALRAWQFPVLLKYTLGGGRDAVRPFFAVGPSFRTQEDVAATEPSQRGATAGFGATVAWKRLRFAPSVRYTRWARDPVSYPRFATRQDQLEFLTTVGVSSASPNWTLYGRRLGIGAMFGLPLTPGFRTFSFQPPIAERFRYAAGIVVDAHLSDRWAIAANGIYKPLRAKSSRPDRPQLHSVLTWQIPVLLRHRWQPKHALRPFLESGPSFRLAGNLNAFRPSRFGATGGAGIERTLAQSRVFTSLRYTRWASEPRTPSGWTNPNAVELWFGISF